MSGSDWFNEPDWFASDNPGHLATIIDRQGVKSGRKSRLAAVECCRQAWKPIEEPFSHILELGERYADGEVKFQQLQEVARSNIFDDPESRDRMNAALGVLHRNAHYGLADVVFYLLGMSWGGPSIPEPWLCPDPVDSWSDEARGMAEIIRDIFGNPFRPAEVASNWKSETAVALATGIYEQRAFDRLPILADALEDVGCDNLDILNHCRKPGRHARGCWVVDLVLGRE